MNRRRKGREKGRLMTWRVRLRSIRGHKEEAESLERAK
jgi:hypothetical protein